LYSDDWVIVAGDSPCIWVLLVSVAPCDVFVLDGSVVMVRKSEKLRKFVEETTASSMKNEDWADITLVHVSARGETCIADYLKTPHRDPDKL